LDGAYIDGLIREHRAIEERLDQLAIEAKAIRELAGLLTRHYSTEERFLTALAVRDATLAAKLRGQHEEALEIAARLLESLETGDAGYLARRLVAIVQHNIIEEERDVFPLVGRDRDQF
jgi:hypothetical protein